MYELENENGIFCDAIATKNNATLFASLWGRSAAIMSLYGAITTGAVTSLLINGHHYEIGKELNKHQTRMPKTSRYGSDLVHAMLYANITVSEVAGKQVLLSRDLEVSSLNARLWQTVKNTSEIGLLEHWKYIILAKLEQQELIKPLEGFGVYATLIDLSDRDSYEQLICKMIKSGQLREEQ